MYYGTVARIVEIVGELEGVYYYYKVKSVEDKKEIIR
jgi:hypothetical protein